MHVHVPVDILKVCEVVCLEVGEDSLNALHHRNPGQSERLLDTGHTGVHLALL